MRGFDLYCCFCAGPLDNARRAWLREVRNWSDIQGLISFPCSSAPAEDIVTISEEDGRFWDDFVCVSQHWGDSFVSTKAKIENNVGKISIEGSSAWQNTVGRYLVIHRQCLSFLTRRINATPRRICESLFAPGSDYMMFRPRRPTLLHILEYYDMDGRNEQWFRYTLTIERQTFRGDGGEGVDRWYDPSSMVDLQWILARPSVFPNVHPLQVTVTGVASNSTDLALPDPPSIKVFKIPELFDLVLDFIVKRGTRQEILEQEMRAITVNTPPSVTEATRTIFSLLQANKELYIAIVRHRQDIFLRLAWDHGWMLPATPYDWKHWQNGTFHNGKSFIVDQDKDWKAYLLSFLRKEDVHIKNRWRFHRMALQFARGRLRWNWQGEITWRWRVGELGVRTEIAAPKPLPWEED